MPRKNVPTLLFLLNILSESFVAPWTWTISNFCWFVVNVMKMQRIKKTDNSEGISPTANTKTSTDHKKRKIIFLRALQYFCELQLSLEDCFPKSYLPYPVIAIFGFISAVAGLREIMLEETD
jgi:hypothetical protein